MPKRPAEKPSHLSEEFVVDSDDDKNVGGDFVITDGPSKDQESSSSDESDGEGSRAEATEKVASAKAADDDLSSDSSSGDSDTESGKVADEKSSAADDSSSDTSESEASESSSRKRSREDGDAQRLQLGKRRKTSEVPVKFSRKAYTPPAGYKPVSLGTSDFASDTAALFSNLDGKQIWHISAPASLNIASIKSLDIEAALRGDAVMIERSTMYGLQQMDSKSEVMMLAQDTSANYKASKVKISKSFSLKVIAGSTVSQSTSSLSKDHSTFVARSPGQKKPPRQQPDGLRMRYQPFGSTTAKDNHQDSALPSKKTPVRVKKVQNPAGAASGKRFVITDPIIVARSNISQSTPADTLKPLIFSTPNIAGEDVEMDDAISPAKNAEIDGQSTAATPSKAARQKANGTSLKESGKPNTKKRKSKLTDVAGL